jgi:hypothetical protein
MIQVYSMEQRTMVVAGKAPITIRREVEMRNGKGRKTIKVLRGSRLISSETEHLGATEKKKVQKRKFVKGLYKGLERKTRKRLQREAF